MANTTVNPREIDSALSKHYEARAEARRRQGLVIKDLHRVAGDQTTGKYGTGRWMTPDAEIVEKVRSMAAEGNARAAEFIARYDEHQATIDEIKAQADPLNDIYREHRWSRFFLVSGKNGHIHSSMECSTCNHRGKRTAFSWLPALSGKTQADAVAEHGAMLCTVCFPDAPVEWTNYWEQEEERKQAESCPGSGTTDWIEGTTRFGYVSGNGGKCSHCGQRVAATSLRKMRKHKPSK